MVNDALLRSSRIHFKMNFGSYILFLFRRHITFQCSGISLILYNSLKITAGELISSLVNPSGTQ